MNDKDAIQVIGIIFIILLIAAFGLLFFLTFFGFSFYSLPFFRPPYYEDPISYQPPSEPIFVPSISPNGCYIGGCSSQICSDNPAAASTCEWKDEYACYQNKNVVCEKQSNGQCGWRETDELKQCLKENQ